MSVEECPYCGKPFKRLKSHLPHCKMAPVPQPLKIPQTPQDLLNNTTKSKQKVHNKISTADKNKILNERKTYKDLEKVITNAESSQATSEVTSVVSTEKPKSKWSAKRQKEHERWQQMHDMQKLNNSTSLSDHETDKTFNEISNGQTQRASQTNDKTTKAKNKEPRLSEHLSQTIQKNKRESMCNENPKHSKVPISNEIEPNNQNSDVHLLSTVEEPKPHLLFISKTSVWDHIKDSLHLKRSCNQLVPRLGSEICKDFAPETKEIGVQQSNDIKTSSESAIHRFVEDQRGLRLQSVRSLEMNPEILTAYRILISTKPYRTSINENMRNKPQFCAPSSHNKVPLIQRRLGDVRLNELGVWLGAKSPKSPRETLTMLIQGWHWYYRKYINVRKGGIGGISLFLAGYCVLGYIWRYPHLKKERWRKYH